MSHIEKFQMQEMHRSELKKHPLNPRKITAEAKRRLKAGLERFGLVQPLIFNRRTGLLVGGHQRLSCLDDIHEGKDYSLNVAVVDVDETKEKELVVFLNNTSSMGFWDDESLLDILSGQDVDKSALGFNASEMEYFDKLMKEADQDTAAAQYFREIEQSYDTLQESAEENREEIEEDKVSRKQKWEQTVSQFFEPPPPRKEVNLKADDELTDEEKKARMAFREAREGWKKKDTNDEEIVVRILFTSRENCRKWLQKTGLPPEQTVLHEKELPE